MLQSTFAHYSKEGHTGIVRHCIKKIRVLLNYLLEVVSSLKQKSLLKVDIVTCLLKFDTYQECLQQSQRPLDLVKRGF